MIKGKLCGLDRDFDDFRKRMGERDETFKFWDSFVHEDAMSYLGLYTATRSGKWDLRNPCIKKMTPMFSVCDQHNHARILPQHLSDIATMPEDILENFRNGGFVSSLKGTPYQSQAIDEAHESTINRDVKMAISRNNENLIVSKSIPPFQSQDDHKHPLPNWSESKW